MRPSLLDFEKDIKFFSSTGIFLDTISTIWSFQITNNMYSEIPQASQNENE